MSLVSSTRPVMRASYRHSLVLCARACEMASFMSPLVAEIQWNNDLVVGNFALLHWRVAH